MSRLGLEVRNMPIKKIFVSSPLRGDIEKNIENAFIANLLKLRKKK